MGDPVFHPDLGHGVIQAFTGDLSRTGVVVRFYGLSEAREVDGGELRALPIR